MTWLSVAILSYFILAVVFLFDKYLLGEKRISSPALYAFYNAVLSISIFLLAPLPFVDFSIPSFSNFLLAVLVGAVFILALFWFYRALHLFETSRVVPVVGALSPIFSFFIVFIFTKGSETISFLHGIAFSFLVFGTFLIAYQKTKTSLKSFLSSAWAAFFFALFFILQKNVFEQFQSFWNSLIWMSIGAFFMAICFFLFSKEVRKAVLAKKAGFRKKIAFIFIFTKSLGSLGGFLQRAAVFLTPGFIEVPIVQSLQGAQYAFLFILIMIFSKKFPGILKEKISKKIIIQKSLAIILIGAGLAILILFDL